MEVQQLLITAGLGCMGIILIIVIHVCILHRCSNPGNHSTSVTVLIQSGQSCRRTSMSSDDLKKLPSFNYRAEDHSNDDSSMECAVCLEGFKIGEMCRLLPICNHSFHAQCIDSWLLNTPSCPVCRTCAISKNSSSEKQHPAV